MYNASPLFNSLNCNNNNGGYGYYQQAPQQFSNQASSFFANAAPKFDAKSNTLSKEDREKIIKKGTGMFTVTEDELLINKCEHFENGGYIPEYIGIREDGFEWYKCPTCGAEFPLCSISDHMIDLYKSLSNIMKNNFKVKSRVLEVPEEFRNNVYNADTVLNKAYSALSAIEKKWDLSVVAKNAISEQHPNMNNNQYMNNTGAFQNAVQQQMMQQYYQPQAGYPAQFPGYPVQQFYQQPGYPVQYCQPQPGQQMCGYNQYMGMGQPMQNGGMIMPTGNEGNPFVSSPVPDPGTATANATASV